MMLSYQLPATSYQLPDAKQADAVIRARLGSLSTDTSLARLSEHTAGLSHADLIKAAETAAKTALMRGDAHVSRGNVIDALTARRLTSCLKNSATSTTSTSSSEPLTRFPSRRPRQREDPPSRTPGSRPVGPRGPEPGLL